MPRVLVLRPVIYRSAHHPVGAVIEIPEGDQLTAWLGHGIVTPVDDPAAEKAPLQMDRRPRPGRNPR